MVLLVDLFWDTLFFEKKMPASSNMNDFLAILGSAKGAHRGSNEPCSPVLKTLLGPNGPKNHPRAPQRFPKAFKITPTNRCSSILCGVLTSFVILFWHAIPWQRSKHHKTKQKKCDSGPVVSQYPVTHFAGRVPKPAKHL